MSDLFELTRVPDPDLEAAIVELMAQAAYVEFRRGKGNWERLNERQRAPWLGESAACLRALRAAGVRVEWSDA